MPNTIPITLKNIWSFSDKLNKSVVPTNIKINVKIQITLFNVNIIILPFQKFWVLLKIYDILAKLDIKGNIYYMSLGHLLYFTISFT